MRVCLVLPAGLVGLMRAGLCSAEAGAWAVVQVFQQPHYWAAQAGPLLCIGLSTIRFRSNNFRSGPADACAHSLREQAAPQHTQMRLRTAACTKCTSMTHSSNGSRNSWSRLDRGPWLCSRMRPSWAVACALCSQ